MEFTVNSLGKYSCKGSSGTAQMKFAFILRTDVPCSSKDPGRLLLAGIFAILGESKEYFPCRCFGKVPDRHKTTN